MRGHDGKKRKDLNPSLLGCPLHTRRAHGTSGSLVFADAIPDLVHLVWLGLRCRKCQARSQAAPGRSLNPFPVEGILTIHGRVTPYREAVPASVM